MQALAKAVQRGDRAGMKEVMKTLYIHIDEK
jgi:hypothetical protein